MKKRTCEELGACQARAECHVTCSAPAQNSYPFAPGVIQGQEEHGEPLGRMKTLGCWLTVLASLGALVALVGFAAGYFNLAGLLP